MKYVQLTSDERYMISQLKWQGFSCTEIADLVGRHRSTVYREIRRNATTHDGVYRATKAIQYAKARRSRSRRNWQFTTECMTPLVRLLKQDYSPEQASAILKQQGVLSVCVETVYAFIRRDRKAGGKLFQRLRHAGKQKRKRYARADSRGRLGNKRSIHDRPQAADNRSQVGHWEIDTVMGKFGTKPCILTLVDRKTGYLLIGQLNDRTTASTNKRLRKLIRRSPDRFKTITADNGTEFHGYKVIEQATNTPFYFADPYHSWQRGTNENTNGLIRQYLPKGTSMEAVTQQQCNRIANILNNRPRKRYGFKSPAELFERTG